MADKPSKVIGQPVDRIDGWLKVTGNARYAAEFPAPNLVYAVAVNSTIAAGRINGFDTRVAEQTPGVLSILTYRNAPKLRVEHPFAVRVLQDDRIHHHGQIIALVIAETFEQASFAARLVLVDYIREPARIDFDAHVADSYIPKIINAGHKTETGWGNIDQGLAMAAATVDSVFDNAIQHHHPMEPNSILANWEGDQVVAYLSTQNITQSAAAIASAFQLPKEHVRVQGPYVGGGFGGKIFTREETMLAVMASRLVKRPVKLVYTRQQMFMHAGMRQHDRQRIRLGAKADGTLTALAHETVTFTAMHEEFIEQCGALSRMLYNVPNSLVTHKAFRLNVQTPRWMRAPGEAPGSFALESALDELAYTLKIDPVTLRIRNDTQHDLEKDRPFSTRHLVECLQAGAAKFGWEKRAAEPRTQRQGDWLIGYGVSTTSRGAPYNESSARIDLIRQNDTVHVVVKLAATDIGTGSYTIIAQTAAESLNLPLNAIEVQLGDSDLPDTPGSGGSSGASSFTGGVRAACALAWQQLRQKAPVDTVQTISALMLAAKLTAWQTTATGKPDAESKLYSPYAFGACFAEVWVDEALGKIRIPRFVTAVAGGRILNPKTAYAQIMGGVVWGIGMALMEESILDARYGNFITRTFADYHVPVNLDIGQIEVVFVPEEDKIVNPLGVKGLGELGIIGVAAAVGNAVFNATGKRIRQLPITPDKLI